MDSKERGQWGSNLGFILAAVGSAVGLGNIWGFPYKMGKSGGFTFLIVYIAIAILVGFIIMMCELSLGRKYELGPIHAYQKACKKFTWLGWFAVLTPFLIMSFYSVLGGYCIQYISVNLAELSFGLQSAFGIELTGGNTFGAMLTNPLGCVIFTLFFMIMCYLINKTGAQGIEKFNKVGMPALFVMLLIVIVRALTMEGAVEGLKFMFVPGYAVKAGFIAEAPDFVTVLGTAGGQMFFSLSLAMGAMITYGSFLKKDENIKKSSGVIVFADTLVAFLAGLAVIPAAVANGIQNGMAYSDIKLSGPNLLFVTLQNVFAEMGGLGPLFGVIFYALVLIAAISSAISLVEVISTFFVDRANKKGKTPNKSRIALWVCIAIMVEAALVAWDGLGSNGVWVPGQAKAILTYNDCWLDFMDCWSEGIMMPLGAMACALMVGWTLKPKFTLDEMRNGSEIGKGFATFFSICVKVVAPLAMCFIFAGQLTDFFGNKTAAYIISIACLVICFLLAVLGNKKEEK